MRSSSRRTLSVRPVSRSRAPFRGSSISTRRTSVPGTSGSAFSVFAIRFHGDGVTGPTDSATCVAPPVVAFRPPAVAGGGGGGGSSSAAPPASTATVVSLAGAPVPAAQQPAAKPAAKAAALKLTSARLVFKNGTRYLVVRVNGAAKTAKVGSRS